MAHVSDSDAVDGFNQEPFVSVSVPPQLQDSSRIASLHKIAPSSCDGQLETFDSATVELQKIVNGDDLHGKPSAECGATEGKPVMPSQDSGFDNVLEIKKKRLLEELESVLLPKDEFSGDKNVQEESLPIRPSLGIEVIDETALVEIVPVSEIGNKANVPCIGSKKCIGKDVVKEIDVKSGKQSRRRAKDGKKVLGMNGKHKSVAGMVESRKGSGGNGNGTKIKYSRKEMEALRFVNMAEQRKIWKAIYSGLDAAVAKEYDGLASSENLKHIRLNYDPSQCLAKKKEAPAVLSVGAANGRWRYVNVSVH